MSTESYLQLLDPTTDLHLYHTAYNWREGKRHVLPDRMSFKSFTDPNALAIGLFNGELQAVYFLHEVEPRVFQAHFTSRHNVSRETLLAGARQVAEAVLTNGATEIHGWVAPRNTPLRSFLSQLGFVEEGVSLFPCAPVSNETTLHPDERNQRREFVKYVLRKVETPLGTVRPQANFHADRNHDESVRVPERT